MLKRWLRRREKLNNQGLSLVEVVVAITILTVAIGPMLFAFVQSAGITRQANIKQRGTNAAQQIMENYKAYELKDVVDAFKNGTFLEQNKGTYDVADVNENGFGTYRIQGFSFSDATAADNAEENVLYDAVIEVKEGAEASGFGVADTTKSLLNLDYMDPNYDGFYQGEPDDSNVIQVLSDYIHEAYGNLKPEAIKKVKEECASKSYSEDILGDDIYPFALNISSLNREMKLNVGSDRSLVFKYEYNATIDYLAVTQRLSDARYVAIKGTMIIPGSFEQPKLITGNPSRNMYYFYYPLYKKTNEGVDFLLYDDIETDGDGLIEGDFDESGLTPTMTEKYVGAVSDKLTVSGSLSDTFELQDGTTYSRKGTLFLYKQADPDLAATQLASFESSYSLEGNAISAEVCHNLTTNLGTGIVGGVPTQPFAVNNGVAGNPTFENISEDTQMLYTIHVTIMESGQTEVVTEMEGTRIEKHVKGAGSAPTPTPSTP